MKTSANALGVRNFVRSPCQMAMHSVKVLCCLLKWMVVGIFFGLGGCKTTSSVVDHQPSVVPLPVDTPSPLPITTQLSTPKVEGPTRPDINETCKQRTTNLRTIGEVMEDERNCQ